MFNYENVLTVLYRRHSRLSIKSYVFVYSLSVRHSDIKIFILRTTSFGCDYKLPSGLIQEQGYSTKKTLN